MPETTKKHTIFDLARPYQLDALRECRSNFASGINSQVIQIATGGGKTFVASMFAHNVVAKGGRLFFIVDSLELVDQAAERFINDGLKVGIIQGTHEMTDYSKPVQVATIQTLRARWGRMHESLKPTVVIIDECHVIHKAHEQIIRECKHKSIPVIGLSATPFRKGLGNVFDRLVVGATTSDLTDLGYLSSARCFAPFIPELSKVRTKSDGDWHEDALADYMGEAKIVGDVVKNWQRLGEGRQTIVFACNVAHSKLLRDAFKAKGIAADHVDGYERDPKARAQKIADFKSGKTTVLCNVAVLTKGFDAPSTSCLVIARPTKSLMMHIQILGRGLRVAEGKKDCVIIDHAGNCIRNGLPTDPLPAMLDDGTLKLNLDRKQKERKEREETPCFTCGFIKLGPKCPSCGHVAERTQDVEKRDGELRELVSAKKLNRDSTPEEKARFFGELKAYGRIKNYNKHWASNQYKQKFGVWPNKYKDVPERAPTEETLNFIKHRQIAYAKRRVA